MASSGCAIHFVVFFHGHGWPEFEAESQSALNPTVEALNNPSLPDPVSIEKKGKRKKEKRKEKKERERKEKERKKYSHN